MRSSTAGAILILGALLGAVSEALAQDEIRVIKGVAVDSASNKPVAQAAIYIGRKAWGERTAKDGSFQVSAPVEPLWLMIRRPGYVPALLTVSRDTAASVADLGTVCLRPVKTDADRSAVRAVDLKVFPELARFYQHKTEFPQGLFFTPDDLQRQGGNLVDILRLKPQYKFICIVNRKHEVDCGQQLGRGPTSIMRGNPSSAQQEPCPLQVWTNGGEPFHNTLDNILTESILAAEAYPNPGVTPPIYAGSPCAALILYMKESGP